MNLSLVVLAAGASRRFGAANKLLQLLDGKPLLCHTLEPVSYTHLICLTEYGGYNCAVPGHCWGEGAEFGYKKIADPMEFNLSLIHI